MADLRPNELCSCGSGRKYKHCHGPIETAAPEEKYAVAQGVYARSWRVTSRQHDNDGDYVWMAHRLTPYRPTRVLDIGCGSGYGVLALFKTGSPDLRVVSIDENPECVANANELLSKEKISVEVVRRLESNLTPTGFENLTRDFDAAFSSQCTLIEGDIVDDEPLETKLRSLQKFDAVTIWCVGTHMMRREHRWSKKNKNSQRWHTSVTGSESCLRVRRHRFAFRRCAARCRSRSGSR